jgi:nitroreductase
MHHNHQFTEVAKTIRGRRSVSWSKMNGKAIPDSTINELLALADWAPTHGRTEPWYFLVYTGESLRTFGKQHADLYWSHTPEDKRQQATYDKLLHNGDMASHLLVAVMKRGTNVKIPQLEEIAAASAAIQNVLLGATALGIASFWSTGGMTHTHALKEHLGFGADDLVMGLVFLGYSDEPAADGVRKLPLEEKVKWL